ncbi:MAG: FolB domain-containing protein [Marinilabiliaceae bacterium]|nr:FolB domain-containing protein [Marinilabiliaceae bacterium]
MAILYIKNLFLRSYIGFSEHELGKLQDIVINITIDFKSEKAECTDNPDDTLNYKILKHEIIKLVEVGRFKLIEALARQILNMIMSYAIVSEATVEIDKPHALRFADSVSISLTHKKDE